MVLAPVNSQGSLSTGERSLIFANAVVLTSEVTRHRQYEVSSPPSPGGTELVQEPASTTKLVPSSAIRFMKRDPTSLFSRIYPNNASVNAGSYSLVVGLGGINGAFAVELRKISHLIRSLHREAYQLALKEMVKAKKEMVKAKRPSVENTPLTKLSFNGDNQPISQTLVRLVPELSYDRPAGTVLIDVFGPRAAPNPNAMAMVYLVGPDGRQPVYDANPKKFLRAVELTAANFVLALNEYNKANKSRPIESVRLCLFSSGFFKHPGVTVQELSQRILQTILKKRVCGVTPEIHCVDFPRYRSSQRLEGYLGQSLEGPNIKRPLKF